MLPSRADRVVEHEPRALPGVINKVLNHNKLLVRAQADEGYVAVNMRIDKLGQLATEQAQLIDAHIAESKTLGTAQLRN